MPRRNNKKKSNPTAKNTSAKNNPIEILEEFKQQELQLYKECRDLSYFFSAIIKSANLNLMRSVIEKMSISRAKIELHLINHIKRDGTFINIIKSKDCKEILELLLPKDVTTYNQNIPMLIARDAIEENKTHVLELLIEKKFDINSTLGDNTSLLLMAGSFLSNKNDNLKMFEFLITNMSIEAINRENMDGWHFLDAIKCSKLTNTKQNKFATKIYKHSESCNKTLSMSIGEYKSLKKKGDATAVELKDNISYIIPEITLSMLFVDDYRITNFQKINNAIINEFSKLQKNLNSEKAIIDYHLNSIEYFRFLGMIKFSGISQKDINNIEKLILNLNENNTIIAEKLKEFDNKFENSAITIKVIEFYNKLHNQFYTSEPKLTTTKITSCYNWLKKNFDQNTMLDNCIDPAQKDLLLHSIAIMKFNYALSIQHTNLEKASSLLEGFLEDNKALIGKHPRAINHNDKALQLLILHYLNQYNSTSDASFVDKAKQRLAEVNNQIVKKLLNIEISLFTNTEKNLDDNFFDDLALDNANNMLIQTLITRVKMRYDAVTNTNADYISNLNYITTNLEQNPNTEINYVFAIQENFLHIIRSPLETNKEEVENIISKLDSLLKNQHSYTESGSINVLKILILNKFDDFGGIISTIQKNKADVHHISLVLDRVMPKIIDKFDSNNPESFNIQQANKLLELFANLVNNNINKMSKYDANHSKHLIEIFSVSIKKISTYIEESVKNKKLKEKELQERDGTEKNLDIKQEENKSKYIEPEEQDKEDLGVYQRRVDSTDNKEKISHLYNLAKHGYVELVDFSDLSARELSYFFKEYTKYCNSKGLDINPETNNNTSWQLGDETVGSGDITQLGSNLYATISPKLLSNIDIKTTERIQIALEKGFRNTSNKNGIKNINNKVIEIKFSEDLRVYSQKIFVNKEGNSLIYFDNKGNHETIKGLANSSSIIITKCLSDQEDDNQNNDNSTLNLLNANDHSNEESSLIGLDGQSDLDELVQN